LLEALGQANLAVSAFEQRQAKIGRQAAASKIGADALDWMQKGANLA
jgi:hypothetical protein